MFRVSLLVSLATLALGVPKQGLYPFGDDQGDKRLPVGDDISSEEVQLTTSVAFYDNLHQSLFVNLNGHVSFETEVPAYKSDLIIPIFGFKIIAPFLADADNRLSGNVYYRESMDPALLDLATREITTNWPSRRNFRPTHIFIVTWDEVGYYDRQYDKVNTFQLVLANNGGESYALFHYTDDGIQWIRGQGKARPVANDVPAQVGFNAGDNVRYTTLPGSGSENIKDLAILSNMAVPGVWVYRIGLTSGGNVEAPETYVPPGLDRQNPNQPQTCASGGAQACSQNSRCQDYQGGFCCECASPHFGNGKHCLKEGTRMRINGKVTGTVNGISIDNQDLHSYVVTKDGRAHTAISRIPASIGVPLQTAYAVGGVIGWLFARPTSSGAKNGFMLTGGAFNRTARIQYVDGGLNLEVQQQFTGLDVEGYMRVNTQLNGKVPNIAATSKVTVDDYKVEFSKVGRGLIKSYTTQLYNVDGIPKRINIDQTIRFDECVHRPDDDATMMRLNVIRNFLVYGDRDQIVRFAQTNKISLAGESTNPCTQGRNDCDVNAKCIPTGDTYRCECKSGYYGDGRRCADEDECARGNNDCSPDATCYNTEGSFTCRCLPGFRGDGKTCASERTCADISCDRNARCLRDERGMPVCQCNPGYYGDGQICQAVEFGCNEVNNCGDNAECLYDDETRQYKCECADGFSGDGFTCTDTGDAEINCRNCDNHARCVYDISRLIFRCQCLEGYTGDGYTCTAIYAGEEECNILNNCDANARCIFDSETRGYTCMCHPGFTGDGYRCLPEQPSPMACNVANNCHTSARCTYMDQTRRYECRCNPGYAGDGYRCVEDCSVRNFCDSNAQCQYDAQLQAHSCVCRAGFEGDGRQCRLAEIVPGTCNSFVDFCHEKAECMKRKDGQFVCRCVPGYMGDGLFCEAIGDCSLDPSVCDRNARCVRRGGLYVCECNQAYQGDGRRCAPTGEQESYLMYTQGTAIVQVPFRPTKENPGKLTMLVPGQTAIGIDADCFSRYFYWTDVSGHTISRAKMDGSDSEVILRDLSSPEGVAIDWISGTMYWADSGNDKIEVAKVDGSYRKTLFDTNLVNPRGIAVDPASGLLFWTDWNRASPKVESAYMDGSQRTVVIKDNLGLPNGLAIDYEQRQICWADAGTTKIECSGYDGRQRRVIYSQASYPFGLVYINNIFYWTDWQTKSLPNIGQFGGQPNESLKLPEGTTGRTYGIAAVRSQCPRGSNACAVNNGGCRYLCLPTPNGGRTCACPDNVDEAECNTIIRK